MDSDQSTTVTIENESPTDETITSCSLFESSEVITNLVVSIIVALVVLSLSIGLAVWLLKRASRKKDTQLLNVGYQSRTEEADMKSSSEMVENELYEVGIPSPSPKELSRSKHSLTEPIYQDADTYEAVY